MANKEELDYFSRLIATKLATYNHSPLTPYHDHLLKIFFDLAQQHDGLDAFYQICIAVPQALHPELDISLAVLTGQLNQFQPVYASTPQVFVSPELLAELPLQTTIPSWLSANTLILPILARPIHNGIEQDQDTWSENDPSPCLGGLFISAANYLNDIDRLFLEKLTSRMGYNLQRRLLQAEHLEHVNFLKQLGQDIGHNVITPNMHFKYLFKQLEKKINLIDIEAQNSLGRADDEATRIITRCNEIRSDLATSHAELLNHYNRTSLYLETLLREEHFTEGKFVLKTRHCLIEEDIIFPELEIYRKRLEQQQINIHHPQNMQGRQFTLKADLGLLSQVFDNLFSNAVKYTTETHDNQGRPRKAIAYGCRDIANFPKKGARGVKFNIFSTGNHLSEEEQLTIFNDGVRGNNVGHNPGSGHGLAFVRNIIEIHGGRVGYEAVAGGNNFFFILPLAE